MRARDGCMISACVLSLLFSLLTLIAGCKKGVLNHVSIATVRPPISSLPQNASLISFQYSYDGNLSYINEAENSSYINSTDPLIQALRSPTYPDEFHEWYFEVHYLSLCAGFMGGTEDAYYYQLNCSYRPGSFIFRTDDPFIVDYQAIGGEYPVEAGGPFESFDLRPPFACLVLGIVFSILSLGVVLCDICGWGRWSDLSLVSVGVSMVR